MSQHSLEQTVKSKSKEANNNSHHLYQSVFKDPAEASSFTDDVSKVRFIKSNILPDFQLTGFEQEPTNQPNVLTDGFKALFGAPKNLGDEVQKKIVSNLSPMEKEAYNYETTKRISHTAEQIAREALALRVGIHTAATAEPATPVHDLVKQKALAEERKIEFEVRSQMSPADRAHLDKQLDAYEKSSPVTPGILMTTPDLKPEPGNAVKDYWDRIREATNNFTQIHPRPVTINLF